MLLLGALLGLFGQQAAYAVGAGAAIAPASVSQMDADCMEMMQKQSQPAEKPCKGLTLDCIAAMGCVVPALLGGEGTPLATPQPLLVPAFLSATSVLVGSDVPPEQHPPAILG